MMLLTKANKAALPPLYSQDGKDPADVTVEVKFFLPGSRWTWYATEFDGEDTFFGYVVSGIDPSYDELGYFSLSELESIRLKGIFKVERDRGFKRTLREVMDASEKGGYL